MEHSETLTDILGQNIEPGDLVVYPQMSGRSVQMVVAEFQSYNGKTAKLMRQEGSRWQAEYRGKRYIDTRSDKSIGIWTDEWYPEYRRWKTDGFPDWLRVEDEPKRPVTIRNVENIIKVGGPDDQ